MKAIVAMSTKRTIGYQGRLPWPKLNSDLKFFKNMTNDPVNGGYLVMGNTTYKSVGSLPNRLTYILTNDMSNMAKTPFVTYLNKDLFLTYQNTPVWNKMWLCGGAKTYEALIPYCNEVYATHILEDYPGDTYMPEFEDQFPNQEIIKETNNYWIVRYWK